MLRLLCLLLAVSTACGGDDDGGPAADAAALPDTGTGPAVDAAAGLTGAYARVIPGYDSEEACRAEHPDELFACLELVSLCPEAEAYILFTDIVFDGVWVEEGQSATVTFETWDAAFSDDGTTVFVADGSGAIDSDEVYGDKPFDPSSRDEDSLCP